MHNIKVVNKQKKPGIEGGRRPGTTTSTIISLKTLYGSPHFIKIKEKCVSLELTRESLHFNGWHNKCNVF